MGTTCACAMSMDGLHGGVNTDYGLPVSGAEPLFLALTGPLLAVLGSRAVLWFLAAIMMVLLSRRY